MISRRGVLLSVASIVVLAIGAGIWLWSRPLAGVLQIELANGVSLECLSGEKIRVQLEIKNHSVLPIQILSVQPSCGCVEVSVGNNEAATWAISGAELQSDCDLIVPGVPERISDLRWRLPFHVASSTPAGSYALSIRINGKTTIGAAVVVANNE